MISTEMLNELLSITLVEPDTPIPDGAIVAGDLPEELRQVYSKMKQLEQEGAELVERLKQVKREDRDEEFSAQCKGHVAKMDVIQSIFDLELRSAFRLFDKRHVGIAAGWKVWALDAADCHCPECVLERVMSNAPEGIAGVVIVEVPLRP